VRHTTHQEVAQAGIEAAYAQAADRARKQALQVMLSGEAADGVRYWFVPSAQGVPEADSHRV
jgi:hypothetical protein